MHLPNVSDRRHGEYECWMCDVLNVSIDIALANNINKSTWDSCFLFHLFIFSAIFLILIGKIETERFTPESRHQ